jgi:hypothetical protein
MPSLVVSSRFTTDSQILRKAAEQLVWETLRLDGSKLPDWFEPKDDQIAFFFTPPHAFDIAAQLSRTLLGCNPDWILGLPDDYVRRQIRQMTLAAALELPGRSFIKHAVSKAFPAAIYDARSLREATSKVQSTFSFAGSFQAPCIHSIVHRGPRHPSTIARRAQGIRVR